MKQVSAKRRQRLAEARPFRDELIERVGRCELCGRECGKLDCHEVARGQNRERALTERYACLVLGRACHDELHRWPGDSAAAIGLLLIERRGDGDIEAFYKLIGRRWPAAATIEAWRQRLNQPGANP